jgi:anti-sigma factor (TIGR02949 family)
MEHTNCDNLLSQIGDYLDGDISPEACAKLEEHIKGCDHCRVVVDTTEKTISLYHDIAQKNGIPGEVKEKLFKKLNLLDYMKTIEQNDSEG